MDSQEIGVTPINLTIPAGMKGTSHPISLEKDGYKKVSTAITNTTITTSNVILSLIFFAPGLFFTWQPDPEYTFALPSAGVSSAPPLKTGTKPVSRATLLNYEFNDPNELSDWKQITGDWKISGGTLVGKASGGSAIELNKEGTKITGFSGTLKIMPSPTQANVFLWINNNYCMFVNLADSTVKISDRQKPISKKVPGIEANKDWSFSIKEETGNIKFSVNDTPIGNYALTGSITSLTIRCSSAPQKEMSVVIDNVKIEK